TPQNLSTELNRDKVLCPEEVYAQMMLESGNLKSNILNKTNNMLGMRYPYRRKTMATGIYIPAKDTIIYGDAVSLKKYSSLNQYCKFRFPRNSIHAIRCSIGSALNKVVVICLHQAGKSTLGHVASKGYASVFFIYFKNGAHNGIV